MRSSIIFYLGVWGKIILLEGDSEEEGSSEVEGDDDDSMLYGNMFDMIKDAYPQVVCGRESSGNEPQERNGDAKKFYRLLEEVKQPLYPDCEKYSSLSSHI